MLDNLDNDSFNYPQQKVEGYGDDIIMGYHY